MSLVDLRRALKEEKLKFGIKETLKLIKREKIKEVFISDNCPEDWVMRLKKYCEISNVKYTKLKENSKELGIICKKSFSVSVCSYLK